MEKKQKIAISISSDILEKVDAKIDKVEFKNRSHVIEGFIRKWLELTDDTGWIIVANENRWDWKYPFEYSKNLITVDGKTLIEKQIESLEEANVSKIVIAVSNETWDIENFLSNKKYKAKILFIQVSEETDSWEILLLWQELLQTQKTLFILGDNYFHNLSITDLLYCHNNSNAKLTIVVKPEFDSNKFGNIELQWNQISSFKEKPSDKSNGSYIVNTGVYIIDNSILPDRTDNFKLEYDFFPQYIKKFWAKAYFHNWAWFHVQSDDVVKELSW